MPAAYPHSRTYPGQGSSVLLPLLPTDDPPYRARVLILGGGGAEPQDLDVNTPATETVELLDLSASPPGCGCATHSFNMEQRLIGLVLVNNAANTLSLQAPPNSNIAPPGFYRLFLLNGQGVPSVGSFIDLG